MSNLTDSLRPFIKSVTLGTIAGAWLPMIFTIFAAVIGNGGLWSSLLFATSPLAIVLAFVLAASLLVGLPVTALLSRLRAESAAAYVAIGLLTGFALTVAVLAWINAVGGWWIALLGAFSGAVTGRTWWVEAREANVR